MFPVYYWLTNGNVNQYLGSDTIVNPPLLGDFVKLSNQMQSATFEVVKRVWNGDNLNLYVYNHDVAGAQRLGDIPPGTLFVTGDGIRAVKTKDHRSANGQCACVMLESGEYATFAKGNDTWVQVIQLYQSNA